MVGPGPFLCLDRTRSGPRPTHATGGLVTRFLAFPLAIGLLAVACNDNTPTQPESPIDPATDGVSFAVAANSWITRADMPGVERQNVATGVVPNAQGQSIVYTVGGRTMNGASLSTVHAYNAATNVWTYRADLPLPLFRSNGIGVIGGKLYHSGGLVSIRAPSRALFVYDPATNKWTRKRDMPFTGYDGVTAVISNKLYVVTTCPTEYCDPGSPSQSLLRYDPATDTWTTLAPPTQFHGAGAGGVLGGKFYLTGGQSRQLEVYDPATNSWTTRAPMPSVRSFVGSTVLNNKLHVIGGFRADPGTEAVVVHVNTVYDPATDTWVNKKSMPTDRVHISANRVVVGGQARIEVVGGRRPGNNTQYIP